MKAGRLVVSRDGVDVDSAGIEDITFDSDLASIGLAVRGELFMKTRPSPTTTAPAQSERIFFFNDDGSARDFNRPPMFFMGYVDESKGRFVQPFCYMAGTESIYPPVIDDWPRALVRSRFVDIDQYANRFSYPGNLGWGTNTFVRAQQLHGTLGQIRVKWLALA